VFAARHIGWDREHIGSHIVRRNTIYDCGQNGIVGHLGCVFSTIEDNHIYNIALKREFYGYEIAGIKLHAAIDVVIRHNRIHDCWESGWTGRRNPGVGTSAPQQSRPLCGESRPPSGRAQHPRVPASLEIFSQGGTFVSNLVCGTVSRTRPDDHPPRTAQRSGSRLRRSAAATTATFAHLSGR
jgi:hypothetical protein